MPTVLGLDGPDRVKQAFVDLFTFFGMKVDLQAYARLEEAVAKLFELPEPVRFKLLKFKLAAMFSWSMSQPLPKVSEEISEIVGNRPHVLLGGRWYSFIAMVKRKWNKTRRLEFFYSYLMLKKGLPRPSKELIDPEVIETVVDLAVRRVFDLPALNLYNSGFVDDTSAEPRLEAWVDGKAALEEECRRLVDEVIPQRVVEPEMLGTACFPSVRSHIDCDDVIESVYRPYDLGRSDDRSLCCRGSREALGALGVLRRLVPEYRTVCPKARRESLSWLAEEPFFVVEWFQESVLYLHTNPGRKCSDRDTPHRSFGSLVDSFPVRWRFESEGDWILCEVPQVILNQHAQAFVQAYCRRKMMHEVPVVAPMGLAEALKVRVISRGPAHLYTYMHRLQKILFRELTKFDQFAIDAPLTVPFLERVVGVVRPGEVWLSGDYKAATNELHPDLSRAVVNRICDRLLLPFDVRTAFHRAMTDHLVFDESCGEAYFQRWGQLMGSPVSFPVLCIINAAMTRYSLFPKMKLRACPMVINGDDILARTTETAVARWRVCTACAGLAESVGKTYVSDEFFNINSTCYTVDDEINILAIRKSMYDSLGDLSFVTRTWKNKIRSTVSDAGNVEDYVTWRPVDCSPLSIITAYAFDDPESRLVEVPTLNLGLLYGVKRSGGAVSIDDGSEEREGSLSDRCHELIRHFDREKQMFLVRRFIKEHRDRFPGGNVPWFIPENCGGLGLPAFEGTDFFPSNMDLGIAAAIQFGLVKVPCTLSKRTLDMTSKCYEMSSRLCESLFGHTAVDYGGDRLAAHLMFIDAFQDDFIEENHCPSNDRAARLVKFWRESSENSKENKIVRKSASDFDWSWRPDRMFLRCAILAE
jgi:hypothetical protein